MYWDDYYQPKQVILNVFLDTLTAPFSEPKQWPRGLDSNIPTIVNQWIMQVHLPVPARVSDDLKLLTWSPKA